MSYKDLRVLSLMPSRREAYREKMFSDHEVFCGPDCSTVKTPDGFKSIQTPVGIYDVQEIINTLPKHQQPDLLIVKADSTRRNVPVNLSSVNCPKVLILDQTHSLSPAISSLALYARQENFDYICSEENRQHLHFFKDLGFRNVFWSPALSIKPCKQAFRLSRKNAVAISVDLNKTHDFQNRVLHTLTNKEIPVYISQDSNNDAAKLYSQYDVSLNFSENGNLNPEFFKVISSGGFLLSDKLSNESGVYDIFEEGKHFKEYSSAEEAAELSKYCLEHVSEAQSIAREGLKQFEDTLKPELTVDRLYKYVFEGFLDETFQVKSRTGTCLSFSESGLQRIKRYEWVQDLQFNSVKTSLSLSPGAERRLLRDIKDLPRVETYSIKDRTVVDKLILEERDYADIALLEQFKLQPFIDLQILSKSENVDESIVRQLKKAGLKRDPIEKNSFVWKSIFDAAKLLSNDLFEQLMKRLHEKKSHGETPLLQILERNIKPHKYAAELLKNNRACIKALEVKNELEDLALIKSPLQFKTELCQSPLKVLLVTNLFPPQEFGAYGRLMADFSQVLKKRGHQLYVLSSNSPQFGAVPNVEPGVFRSLNLYGGRKNGQNFTLPEKHSQIIVEKNLRTLRTHIQAFSPDVCLLGNIDCLGVELLYELLNKNIPVLHHIGGAWPGFKPEMQPDSPLYIRACISKRAEKAISEKAYPKCRSCVVYPGAATDFFNFSQRVNFDKLRIAFAGIVLPRKGPHLLVNSLADLNRNGIDFSCEIAGATADEKYLYQLKEFIESQRLSHKIRFCGFLNRYGMRELLARSNTLVFPTTVDEGFGISQVEAMAAGLTVVSSGTGGTCEIIQDHINGFLFDPEKEDSLSTVLTEIAGNKKHAEKIALRGQTDALEKFNIVESVKMIEEQFNEALKLSEFQLLK